MYDINSNVLSASGVTAKQLDARLADTGMAGLGQDFITAEEKTGINALFMVAHAALESAWGKSQLANDRNNLFGIGAIDSDPGQAMGFSSKASCVAWYAAWLKKEYLSAGGSYFEGTTLHDIFIHYSSSHDVEAEHVAEIMNELKPKKNATSSVKKPAQNAISRVYTVIEGDNLWNIAKRYGITLGRLERANPQLGPNFDLIHPGDKVNIPR